MPRHHRLITQEDYTDDAHPCGIVSNRSSTLHITEDSPPNTSQIRTRSTTKQLNHCLENQQEYSLKYTNTGKRSCRVITESSQEDYIDEHPYSIVSNRPSTYRTRSVTERLNQQDNYTNEHPHDTAPNRSSAFHITEDSPPNMIIIPPKTEPGQLQNNQTTAWKIKKEDII